MTKNANYRKHNDGSHNSSTYHKKDGTPIRSILKREAIEEIKEHEMSITLATLPYATEQEVFDHVSKHLLSQGCESVKHEEDEKYIRTYCLYRGPNGTKCAAGCLIDDTEYKVEMENLPWQTLCERRIVPFSHQELIVDLQEIHDKYTPDEWSEKLKKLAKNYSLKM